MQPLSCAQARNVKKDDMIKTANYCDKQHQELTTEGLNYFAN